MARAHTVYPIKHLNLHGVVTCKLNLYKYVPYLFCGTIYHSNTWTVKTVKDLTYLKIGYKGDGEEKYRYAD